MPPLLARYRWLLALAGAVALAALVALCGQRRESVRARSDAPAEARIDLEPGAATPATPQTPTQAEPPRRSRIEQPDGALSRGALLLGTVTDDTKQPLPGIRVQAVHTATLAVLATTVTTPSGSFVLDGLPLGEVELKASGPAYRPESRPFVFTSDGERQEVTLALVRGQQITGRVVSRAKAPVARAQVGSSDDRGEWTTTDADGRFRLSGLGSGAVNVFAVASGFATAHVHNVRPGTSDVEVTVELPARVSGEATLPPGVDQIMVSICHFDEAFRRELCPARVVVHAPSTRYELEGLPPGKYDLVAEAEGHPEHRASVELVAGQTSEGPELGNW